MTDERWHLEDRREFLLRSLDDADREHDAGDLGDDDYRVLCRRDQELLADVEARLAELAAPSSGDAERTDEPTATEGPEREHRPRSLLRRLLLRRRKWMLVAGVAALVAAMVLLLVDVTAPRLPGQSATGSITLRGKALITQQVAQAATLVSEGHVVTALELYEKVLSENPKQPEALAEGGWLEWQTGSQTHDAALESAGQAMVTRATVVDPGFYAGHLYLGTIELLGADDPSAAVHEYQALLSEHPPAASLASAAGDIRQAFTDAGLPVPAGVPEPKGGS